jgi:hypothetical protein
MKSLVRRGVRRLVQRLRQLAEADDSETTDPSSLRWTDVNDTFAWYRRSGLASRPEYLWPLLEAARSARSLGVREISALEFGVAGGNGLLALEAAASAVESVSAVRIHVLGFDTGVGMPEPEDHRDVPWSVRPGLFAMDPDALRARLTSARLILGHVRETIPAWLDEGGAPVGFLACDLDFYSSTRDALRLFEAGAASLLPRIPCYFDDVLGYGWTDFNGELAAIAEFNDAHPRRKIGRVYGLRHFLPPSEFYSAWPEKIFVAHIFDHDRYSVVEEDQVAMWENTLALET